MTPEEELALLREIEKENVGDAEALVAAILVLISQGVPAKEAVRRELERFSKAFAARMAKALEKITAKRLTVDDTLKRNVGNITLSQRLYSNAEKASAEADNVVRRHIRGYQNAKEVARQLYEGYSFEDDDILQISRRNKRLPDFMRRAILADDATEKALRIAFARAKVRALKSGNLQAAYSDLLTAIENVENTNGQRHLRKKLKVAVEEKARYFANRIAVTELHRAYAQQQAIDLLADGDVQYVQYRLSPTHPIEDICDYFANVNRYGLGAGVYPKALAPVAPVHPYCKCVLSPRLDLNGKKIKDNEKADQTFFNGLSAEEKRKVAGSKKKARRVQEGSSMWNIWNENTDPVYRVKTAQEVANANTSGSGG